MVALCLFSTAIVSAQQNLPSPGKPVSIRENQLDCGTDILLKQLRQNPAAREREAQMNREILRYVKRTDTADVVLPVVIHIINDNPFAINDQQVIDGLQDLNDAFSKSGAYAASAGADTKIGFCLAKTDPDGGITNGITRTTSYFSNDLNALIEDRRLKNLIQWDPARYINIWLITGMHYEVFFQFSCGTWNRLNAGGYATLPPNAGPLDGIVITGFGRLLAHEMGHYLGLYHTFEGLNCANGNCKTDGDRVCDTPPDASVRTSFSCNNPENSCSTDTLSGYTIDVPDQIANFMDYGNDNCHNEFTQGQADRMMAAINTQRPGLLQNKCDPPCPANAVAAFTRNNSYPIPGDVINFTNNSTGAANYEWLLDDKVVSTQNNFTYTPANIGKFKVTLKAYSNANCFASSTDYVIVNCGVTARFFADKRSIASKAPIYLDTIRFTNISENATAYQWIMSNDVGMAEQVISTAKDLEYVFNNPGNYTLKLIATNGTCSDTTGIFTIPVADPTPDMVVAVTSVNCYQETKVRVQFYFCNFGYAPIPKNTPTSFYDKDPRQAGATKLGTFLMPDELPGFCCAFVYTTILDAGKRGLNQLYIAVNDAGNVSPLVYPNTSLPEKEYNNNVQLVQGFAFKVVATPAIAVAEPGDTLQLNAFARPGVVSSYIWSTPTRLSCTNCAAPNYIADTTSLTTKRVVATSNFGCTDTGYVSIQVPAYNDFKVSVEDVQCAQNNKLHVDFTITNEFKRGILPKGLTVAFYSGDPSGSVATFLPPLYRLADTIAAKQFAFSHFIQNAPEGKIYAVVNDTGQRVVPIRLPVTYFTEKNYPNNYGSFIYVRLKALATPALSIVEPGDTLQLNASAKPGVIASFNWSDAANLSCTLCATPLYTTPFPFGDTTLTKRVIATNTFGCKDTAALQIKIPPYNDYTIDVTDVQCSRNDSLHVDFNLTNNFKRGVLPKGLTVAFYSGDPVSGTATLLPPVFKMLNTSIGQQATFSTVLKGMLPGNLFVVVNDNGVSTPVTLPVTSLLEKIYTNNVTKVAYAPEQVIINPADTTVFRKQLVPFSIGTPIYNAASTRWTSAANSFSCLTCLTPVLTVLNNDVVRVKTENKYGCLIEGTVPVKIFPPNLQVEIMDAKCYTNNTARVTFSICTNNGYDSVPANIPVSFYDGSALSSGRLLPPVFYTKNQLAGNCNIYTATIALPQTNKLTAVVNDKGNNPSVTPNQVIKETDYTDNTNVYPFIPFEVSVFPADTTIDRLGSILLLPLVKGGNLTNYLWSPSTFLSCTTCATPVASPQYTTTYILTARNENACTDTAQSIIRTVSRKGVYVPDAFTPNGDRLNDILYVLGGPEISSISSFSIFDRWGNKIFQVQNVPANNPAFGWNGLYNGREAGTGTFVYYLQVKFVDGTRQSLKGTVVLIR